MVAAGGKEYYGSCWLPRIPGQLQVDKIPRQQLVDKVYRTAAGEKNSTRTADGERRYWDRCW
jgi:hypothetical protein